jgi:hypothetical protein
MRRISVSLLAGLLFCLVGCIPGVGWLPDSSGFVYTTPGGELRAYDLATKKHRLVVVDNAAKTTAWPAVSPDGKQVALADLTSDAREEKAYLQIAVCDLAGRAEFRSDRFLLMKVEGKTFDFSTQIAWSTDGKHLLVHAQGHANQEKGFDCAVIFPLADKKPRILPNHIPAYFGGTPIRPDSAGFLLVDRGKDNGNESYVWADWQGKTQPFKDAGQQDEDDFNPWTALADSRWHGAKASALRGDQRLVLDTDKRVQSFEKAKPADTMIGKESIRMRTKLASGIELLLLQLDDNDKRGPALRLVARKAGNDRLDQVVPPIRDRMMLLSPAPDGRHAILRVSYGYRGAKGDSVHVIDNAGQRVDVVIVHEKR